MGFSSRNLLIVAVSVVLVFFVFYLGYGSHSEVKNLVQEQFKEQQLMLAKQVAFGLEGFLEEGITAIEILAEEGFNKDSDDMASSFGTVYNNTAGFFVIEFINKDGVVVSGYPKEDVPIGYDLYAENRNQAFDAAKAKKRTYITDPVPMFEGGLGLFVWTPVYDGDEFKGVILGIIKLSTITDRILFPIKSGVTGNAYMIDDKGVVIYEKDPNTIGKNYIEIFNNTNMSWAEAMPLIENQVKGKEGTGYYFWYDGDVNNINESNLFDNKVETNNIMIQNRVKQIVSYAPIRFCNQVWSIGIRTPANEVDEMISSLYIRQMAFIIAVIGIIVSWSSYTVLIFSRWNKSLEEEVEAKTNDLMMSNKELEEANIQLRQLDQLKSDFVSMVSHELKTPLSAMKTSAEMLESSSCDEKTQHEMLDIILRNVDRQTRLVEDLLDLSKIESNRMVLDLERLNIKSVIKASIQNIRQLVEEKNLTLFCELPEQPTEMMGDRDRLIQVFINLLENAIKFTNEGGITIKVTDLDEQIEVRIIDTGVGIAPNELDKIFNKFYQVESSKKKTGSAGLGLAICKGIVEAHNGRIWVESQLGIGSTFVFRLGK